jgi:hypothetical protein
MVRALPLTLHTMRSIKRHGEPKQRTIVKGQPRLRSNNRFVL